MKINILEPILLSCEIVIIYNQTHRFSVFSGSNFHYNVTIER